MTERPTAQELIDKGMGFTSQRCTDIAVANLLESGRDTDATASKYHTDYAQAWATLAVAQALLEGQKK